MARFVNHQLNKLILMLCIVAGIASCKKNEGIIVPTGKYSGKLINASGGIVYNYNQGLADVTFTNYSYTATNISISATGYSAPVLTTGTFQIKTDSITFNNNVTVPGTGRVTYLSLAGTYQYHFEGDSLIMTRSYSMGELSLFSQYRLKRN